MPNNPFVVLGISENATQEEILNAYKAKREYYQNHVFDDGEQGAEAARMINVVDQAYQDAMEISMNRASVDGEGDSIFNRVKEAIKSKNTDGAQALLDNMTTRNAEWHYYQSIVFYEKSWLSDSKKQLEIALQMEPSNSKYQRALDNLTKKIDGTNPYKQNKDSYSDQMNGGAYSQQARTQRTYDQHQADVEEGMCRACQALWCADCCCECMGGDLIRCC